MFIFNLIMKQAILVRQDLKLPKGKLASQCAHASVEAVLISDKSLVKEWRNEGMAKIVLKVKDLKELRYYNQIAKDIGLTTALITDAGRTVVEPGTVTCLAIGPDDNEKIDRIVKDLKLL
jgi:PTH2 family peptidyl-tRNA hydrolase